MEPKVRGGALLTRAPVQPAAVVPVEEVGAGKPKACTSGCTRINFQHGAGAPLHAHDEGLGQPLGTQLLESRSGWTQRGEGRARRRRARWERRARRASGPEGSQGGTLEKFLAARAGAAEAARGAEEAALAEVVAAAQEAVTQACREERA